MKLRSLWSWLLPAALAALPACTTADQVIGPTSSTVPAASITTIAPPGSDGPYAPDPAPPLGLPPSFNESAGCGVAQGVRGPYATIVGDLADTEAVRGPWWKWPCP